VRVAPWLGAVGVAGDGRQGDAADEPQTAPMQVVWRPEALAELEAAAAHGLDHFALPDETQSLRAAVAEVIALDPRSVYRAREQAREGSQRLFSFCLDRLSIVVRFPGGRDARGDCEVLSVENWVARGRAARAARCASAQ
jgi:plasmid stabilization system protein ParE